MKNITKGSIKYIDTNIILPPSQFKSIRQLVISALTDTGDKTTILKNFSLSKDALTVIEAMKNFGWKINQIVKNPGAYSVLEIAGGIDKMKSCDIPIYLGNSGLGFRIAMMLSTLGKGNYNLVGDESMSKRTVKDLEKGLLDLGVKVRTEIGYPPCNIEGNGGILNGGDIFVSGKETSQFHTALLIGLAQNKNGLSLRTDNLVSKNYIEMTRQLIEKNGIKVDVNDDYNTFNVKPNQKFLYKKEIEIETDLILATNFLFLTSMIGGKLSLSLPEGDIKSDKWVLNLLKNHFNCKIKTDNGLLTVENDGKVNAFDIDVHDFPFLVPNIAISALLADGKCYIRNANSSNNKMTKRKDSTIPRVLKKLGAEVELTQADMIITPPRNQIKDIEVKSEDHGNDHRIVMALICLSQCKSIDIKIENIECINKSFPEFLNVLDQCR